MITIASFILIFDAGGYILFRFLGMSQPNNWLRLIPFAWIIHVINETHKPKNK